MGPKKRERSTSGSPVPTTEQQDDAIESNNSGAQIPAAEWDAMHIILQYVYDYRTEDGFDPSKLFHRKVNRRVIPEYYDTIKEPIAMSTIKQKVNARVSGSQLSLWWPISSMPADYSSTFASFIEDR